jgi:3-dehydroquinate synthase
VPLLVQSLSVPFQYRLVFTEGVLAADNRALAETVSWREPERRHRLLAVVDRGVTDGDRGMVDRLRDYVHRHEAVLDLVHEPLVVAGGEAAKNDTSLVERVHREIERHHIDRQSFVVAIGGGALLDVVGYAAATAHRGVRLVRLPTTVLSQCDSGVGVKNGINAFGKKNFVGTFAPPFAVVVDTAFLATLSARDVVAGTSEAVKVALVRDGAFFRWIAEHGGALARGERAALSELVRRGAEHHARHIAEGGDPFEHGSARPLDFGHWAAHKLESLTSHRLRHGEAVAIGIALDTIYSARSGLCSRSVVTEVLGLLHDLGFALWDEALAATDAAGRLRVLDGLDEFREHLGGELSVTLLADIGRAVEVHEMDPTTVAAAVAELAGRR